MFGWKDNDGHRQGNSSIDMNRILMNKIRVRRRNRDMYIGSKDATYMKVYTAVLRVVLVHAGRLILQYIQHPAVRLLQQRHEVPSIHLVHVRQPEFLSFRTDFLHVVRKCRHIVFRMHFGHGNRVLSFLA